jgi:hypothetical protein
MKLIGPKQVTDNERTQTTEQVLPHLNKISIRGCASLVQLFILPPSLRIIVIEECPRQQQQQKEKRLETYTSLQSTASTGTPEQSLYPMIRCPCLVTLEIRDCANLVTLPNLPPSLDYLCICGCGKLCSVSGQLGGLERLHIINCNKLQSVHSIEDASSLETLFLSSCQCLASLGSATSEDPLDDAEHWRTAMASRVFRGVGSWVDRRRAGRVHRSFASALAGR